jgi:hypothetical protein
MPWENSLNVGEHTGIILGVNTSYFHHVHFRSSSNCSGRLLHVCSVEGRKAVRAYVYMAARCDGASEHEANALALRIDTHLAGQMNTAMMEFVKISYNGSQLRMISDARLDGFHQ